MIQIIIKHFYTNKMNEIINSTIERKYKKRKE